MASGPDSLGLRDVRRASAPSAWSVCRSKFVSSERVAGAVGELDKAFLAR